jgi:hypothetical protein
MTSAEIREHVARLDTSSVHQEQEAWAHLRDLGVAIVPYLAEAYGSFRKWQGRAALVFHSIRYARVSEDAFRLGLEALSDKSSHVRHRACGLLAYSLNRAALAHLGPLLQGADARTVDDARAAIDAITHQNHHYFVDRDHSGRSRWQVNEGDVGA